MRMQFSKYEGIGNDFIVVEGEPALLDPEQAMALCDRHLGIGGDGVLIVGASSGRPTMRVLNADGSVPEMCGNGIRCVALHLSRTGRVGHGSFEIATDAGPHVCRVLRGGSDGLVEVLMRPASLDPREIGLVHEGPLVEGVFEVGAQKLHLTAVSMGNPHAVTFDDVGDARATLGPRLEKHPRFARGVNAGFARMTGPRAIELFVYERGAGWTQACGTGACAAAVAAVQTQRVPRGEPVEVKLPGGPLTIVVGEPGARVRMTGPARHVFDGTIEL